MICEAYGLQVLKIDRPSKQIDLWFPEHYVLKQASYKLTYRVAEIVRRNFATLPSDERGQYQLQLSDMPQLPNFFASLPLPRVPQSAACAVVAHQADKSAQLADLSS